MKVLRKNGVILSILVFAIFTGGSLWAFSPDPLIHNTRTKTLYYLEKPIISKWDGSGNWLCDFYIDDDMRAYIGYDHKPTKDSIPLALAVYHESKKGDDALIFNNPETIEWENQEVIRMYLDKSEKGDSFRWRGKTYKDASVILIGYKHGSVQLFKDN